jgi:hypothetical protein
MEHRILDPHLTQKSRGRQKNPQLYRLFHVPRPTLEIKAMPKRTIDKCLSGDKAPKATANNRLRVLMLFSCESNEHIECGSR